MQFLMFSKMLQQLSIAEASDVIAGMGFDGVDLTVREGGHVLPEKVVDDLPPAVETVRGKGLAVGMLTTSITRADEEHARAVFQTASQCGVRLLKLGYWRYEGFGSIRRQIQEVRKDLKSLEALALEHGVTAAIHTHSGDFMTGDLAICSTLVEGLDPDAIGIYVDAGHIVVEGGFGAWRQGLDLVSERIRLVAAKSFGWFCETDSQSGRARWRHRAVPFAQGMTNWGEFFGYLKQIGYDGYVSVHSEYHDLSLDELVAQTEADLKLMKQALAAMETTPDSRQ